MSTPPLPPLYVELAHAVGITNPTEKSLLTVLEAVSVLDDAAWGALSPKAQAYFNEVAEQVNNQVEPAYILWPTVPPEAPSAQTAPPKKTSPVTKAPTSAPQAPPQSPAAPLTGTPESPKQRVKSRGGPGNRARGKTWVFRVLCVEHPEMTPEALLQLMAEQHPGTTLPSRISATTILYDVRSLLRILRDLKRLKG